MEAIPKSMAIRDVQAIKLVVVRARQEHRSFANTAALAIIERLGTAEAESKGLGVEGILLKRAPNGYLTTPQAAQMLGYTPSQVRRLCRQGVIAGVRGRCGWLIPESIVKKYSRT